MITRYGSGNVSQREWLRAIAKIIYAVEKPCLHI
jgi:hypothetical protein